MCPNSACCRPNFAHKKYELNMFNSKAYSVRERIFQIGRVHLNHRKDSTQKNDLFTSVGVRFLRIPVSMKSLRYICVKSLKVKYINDLLTPRTRTKTWLESVPFPSVKLSGHHVTSAHTVDGLWTHGVASLLETLHPEQPQPPQNAAVRDER